MFYDDVRSVLVGRSRGW